MMKVIWKSGEQMLCVHPFCVGLGIKHFEKLFRIAGIFITPMEGHNVPGVG